MKLSIGGLSPNCWFFTFCDRKKRWPVPQEMQKIPKLDFKPCGNLSGEMN
jgi:hypothetical protein